MLMHPCPPFFEPFQSEVALNKRNRPLIFIKTRRFNTSRPSLVTQKKRLILLMYVQTGYTISRSACECAGCQLVYR